MLSHSARRLAQRHASHARWLRPDCVDCVWLPLPSVAVYSILHQRLCRCHSCTDIAFYYPVPQSPRSCADILHFLCISQVTLAGEEAAAGPSGSAAAPSKSGAAAAAGSGAKGAAGKAPSLQPFFLRQNHAESDGQGHQAQTAGGAGVSVQAAAQAGVQEEEKKQDMDEYTKQMLAMMGQGGAAAAAAGSREDDEDASEYATGMVTWCGILIHDAVSLGRCRQRCCVGFSAGRRT